MSIELKAGTVLGRHELLVEVGRGGMASVWVARAAAEGDEPERLVAVKAMLPDLAQNLEFRSMFLDEGQLARSIDHPNVVKVYDVAEAHGVLYLAMEWVVGDSLRAIIKAAERRRPIPAEIAARVIADAAAGLHAAHELRGWDGELRELVHCDVSPHNVLIGLDGAVKIVDFGVASAFGAVTELQEGNIRGKFGYMSPEQALGHTIDRRSDVFSLGIVLFELTTGKRLFKGRDKHHTLDLVLSAKVPKPTELDPKYPPGLEAIVMKALRRKVGARYQSADEMKHALERYLVEERIAVPRAGVAGLLKRVLRQRLDQLREAVRAELRARDGTDPGSRLIAGAPIVSADEVDGISVSELEPSSGYSQLSSPTTSGVARFVPPSDPSQTGHSVPDAPPPTSSKSHAPPAKRSSRALVVVTLVLGVLCGVVGTVGVMRMMESPDQADLSRFGAKSSRERAPEGARGATGREPKESASIDDLEVVDEETRRAREAAEPSGARGASGTDESSKKKKEHVVELEEEPEAKKKKKKQTKEEPAEKDVAVGNRPPLNRGAAIAALGSASRSAASCKRSGGPSGPGQASVTFAPSGRVSSASVGGKFAGTSVGSCVASVFRRARIPAFSGGSVTLSRSFRIPN